MLMPLILISTAFSGNRVLIVIVPTNVDFG
jgi:hypothetical protein